MNIYIFMENLNVQKLKLIGIQLWIYKIFKVVIILRKLNVDFTYKNVCKFV